ncbi:AI-2E family transporter [Thiohalorhabdus sp.]|uniref:AI-2E family transporter n=1 Tax=Thiohalorhabdus sp. TaxID=3094134 RepID=UPI002FC34AFF
MKQPIVLGLLALAVITIIFMPVVLSLLFVGVVFGVFLTDASRNVSHWLGLPRKAALTLVVLALLVLAGGLLALMVPRVAGQLQDLMANLPAYLRQASATLRSMDREWLPLREMAERLTDTAADLPAGLVGESERLFSEVAGILSSGLGALGVLLIVFAVAVYIAVEPGMYQRGILFLLPDRWHPGARRVMAETARTVGWWFVGQAISIIILFTAMTLGLWLIGVPFALVFGAFTGLMTFIPSLGPVIAGVPTLIVALTQGMPEMLVTLGLVIVLQNLEGLFITPNIHRRIIALPPALVLASVLVLGNMVGMIGLFVAMPLVVVGQSLAQGIKAEWRALEKAPSQTGS